VLIRSTRAAKFRACLPCSQGIDALCARHLLCSLKTLGLCPLTQIPAPYLPVTRSKQIGNTDFVKRLPEAVNITMKWRGHGRNMNKSRRR
jgi:hypothetical protein